MGKIMAVCTSEIKGIQKSEADAVELRADWGIEGGVIRPGDAIDVVG